MWRQVSCCLASAGGRTAKRQICDSEISEIILIIPVETAKFSIVYGFQHEIRNFPRKGDRREEDGACAGLLHSSLTWGVQVGQHRRKAVEVELLWGKRWGWKEAGEEEAGQHWWCFGQKLGCLSSGGGRLLARRMSWELLYIQSWQWSHSGKCFSPWSQVLGISAILSLSIAACYANLVHFLDTWIRLEVGPQCAIPHQAVVTMWCFLSSFSSQIWQNCHIAISPWCNHMKIQN